MFLQSLTMRGFKSFAKKSKLKFEPGITAIVGPNGSGKSNITDAALWVLGEQSARLLRGTTMQDVIFSGSTTMQSLGVAEVSLVLDNSSKVIPIEYGEVTILRRCYRSGESEYYLNGAPCRLIDIQEILSDTGLGREMYSIISQGRLDEVLGCKPDERRHLIEEAAGVLKFKKRKDRALRRLVSMEEKLTRARDILKEINRQILPLKKQANISDIFHKLNDELKESETALAVVELRQYQRQWESINEALDKNNHVIADLKNELAGEESVISKCEIILEDKSLVAGDIGEERRRVESILQQINSGLLLLEEKGRNLIDRLSELRQKKYQMEKVQNDGSRELVQVEKDKKEDDERLKAIYTKLSDFRKQAEIVKKQSRQVREEYANNLKLLEAERQKLFVVSSGNEKIAFWQKQQKTVNAGLENIKKKRGAVVQCLKELKQKHRSAGDQRSDIKQLVDNLILELTESKTQYKVLLEAQNKLNAKINALNELSGNLKIATDAGPWFIKRKKNYPGLRGILGDLITTDSKYEKAIEAVLKDDVYALIANDFSRIIESFKSQADLKNKFVSVLSTNMVHQKTESLSLNWAVAAINVIHCDDDIRPAVDRLFAKVYIVHSFKEIYSHLKELPPAAMFVTIKGDVLTDRGIARYGFSGEKGIGVISCYRELAELKEMELNNKLKVKKAFERYEKNRTKLENKQNQLSALNAEIQDYEGQVSQKENEKSHLDEQYGNLESQLLKIDEEIRKNKAVLDKYDSHDEVKDITPERIRKVIKGLENKIMVLDKSNQEQIEYEKEEATKLNSCQIEIASLTERQIHLKRRLLNISENLKKVRDNLDSAKQIESALEKLRARVEPVHQYYTTLRLKAEEWSDSLRRLADKELGETKEIREELKSAQGKASNISEQIDIYNKSVTENKVEQAQLEMQVNSTIEHLVNEMQVPLERALESVAIDIDIKVYEQKSRQIKSKIAELGPVNPLASKEFNQLEERHQFLTEQIDDLLQSRKALEKVVIAIDRKIEEKFNNTFETVNYYFKQVFSDLFPGGEVSLKLIEADDQTEAGIEIEAQPHGKALQSISLLSGGERALVGLAFLFAIYHTRPSPFYILDEVEAALDEINLQRFINLLNKLKTRTQFLIITHQRRTMEIADTLYGVSMQADGVSKLISQVISQDEQEEREAKREELAGTAEIGSSQIAN